MVFFAIAGAMSYTDRDEEQRNTPVEQMNEWTTAAAAVEKKQERIWNEPD